MTLTQSTQALTPTDVNEKNSDLLQLEHGLSNMKLMGIQGRGETEVSETGLTNVEFLSYELRNTVTLEME